MVQTLQSGTPLQGGKYVIKQVLGQGGFGITYLAEQVSLGREVAIKEFFMKDGCLRDDTSLHVTVPSTGSAAQVEQYRNKFLKEARTLAGLEHPHIVRVIDVFEENGTVYYSMSYLPNGSLKSRVKSSGKLSEGEALRYVGQVANALKYMHDRNLCHYDVKPDNILLDVNDNAVLIDFGISKNYDAQGKETSTTPIGLSEGFAPIEQYQGINDFSPASDVYALGATLYYLLEGQRPPTAIDRVGGKKLDYPIKVSSQARNLIEQAMAISASARPATVNLFSGSKKDEMPRRKAKAKSPVKEPPREETTMMADKAALLNAEPVKKRPIKTYALVLASLLAIAGIVFALKNCSQEEPAKPATTVTEETVQQSDTIPAKTTPTSYDEVLHPDYWKQGLAICAHFTAYTKGFGRRIEDIHNQFPQGYTLDDLNEVYSRQGQKWEKIYNEFKAKEDTCGSINDLKQQMVAYHLWGLVEPELRTYFGMPTTTSSQSGSSNQNTNQPAREVSKKSKTTKSKTSKTSVQKSTSTPSNADRAIKEVQEPGNNTNKPVPNMQSPAAMKD